MSCFRIYFFYYNFNFNRFKKIVKKNHSRFFLIVSILFFFVFLSFLFAIYCWIYLKKFYGSVVCNKKICDFIALFCQFYTLQIPETITGIVCYIYIVDSKLKVRLFIKKWENIFKNKYFNLSSEIFLFFF